MCTFSLFRSLITRNAFDVTSEFTNERDVSAGGCKRVRRGQSSRTAADDENAIAHVRSSICVKPGPPVIMRRGS